MIKVLLVEANEINARAASHMLAEAGDIQVTHVEKLSTALRRLNREAFDVIVLYGDRYPWFERDGFAPSRIGPDADRYVDGSAGRQKRTAGDSAGYSRRHY